MGIFLTYFVIQRPQHSKLEAACLQEHSGNTQFLRGFFVSLERSMPLECYVHITNTTSFFSGIYISVCVFAVSGGVLAIRL